MDWIKRYLLFHQKKHPREMGRVDSFKLSTANFESINL
ncbi:hypothetical protein, partial [Microcystis aeruginosa]